MDWSLEQLKQTGFKEPVAQRLLELNIDLDDLLGVTAEERKDTLVEIFPEKGDIHLRLNALKVINNLIKERNEVSTKNEKDDTQAAIKKNSQPNNPAQPSVEPTETQTRQANTKELADNATEHIEADIEKNCKHEPLPPTRAEELTVDNNEIAQNNSQLSSSKECAAIISTLGDMQPGDQMLHWSDSNIDHTSHVPNKSAETANAQQTHSMGTLLDIGINEFDAKAATAQPINAKHANGPNITEQESSDAKEQLHNKCEAPPIRPRSKTAKNSKQLLNSNGDLKTENEKPPISPKPNCLMASTESEKDHNESSKREQESGTIQKFVPKEESIAISSTELQHKPQKKQLTIAADNAVTMSFVAVLSADFGFKPQTDAVFIIYGNDYFDYGNVLGRMKFIMPVCSSETKSTNEYMSWLVGNSFDCSPAMFHYGPIYYKYLICRAGRNQRRKWEHLYAHTQSEYVSAGEQPVNRILLLNFALETEPNHYIIVDGSIVPETPSKSITSVTTRERLVNYVWNAIASRNTALVQRRIRDAIDAATHVFCPQFDCKTGFYYATPFLAQPYAGKPLDFQQTYNMFERIDGILRFQLPSEFQKQLEATCVEAWSIDLCLNWLEVAFNQHATMDPRVRLSVALVLVSRLFVKTPQEIRTVSVDIQISQLKKLCALLCITTYATGDAAAHFHLEMVEYLRNIWISLSDPAKLSLKEKLWKLIELCKGDSNMLFSVVFYHIICENINIGQTKWQDLSLDSDLWWSENLWPSYRQNNSGDLYKQKTNNEERVSFKNDLFKLPHAIRPHLDSYPGLHLHLLHVYCQTVAEVLAYCDLYPTCPIALILAWFGRFVRVQGLGSQSAVLKTYVDLMDYCNGILATVEPQNLMCDFKFMCQLMDCFYTHSKRSSNYGDLTSFVSFLKTWTLLICRLNELFESNSTIECAPTFMETMTSQFKTIVTSYLLCLSRELSNAGSDSTVAEMWAHLFHATGKCAATLSDVWITEISETASKYYKRKEAQYLQLIAKLDLHAFPEKLASFYEKELETLLQQPLMKGDTLPLKSLLKQNIIACRPLSAIVQARWGVNMSFDETLACILQDLLIGSLIQYFDSNKNDENNLSEDCKMNLQAARKALDEAREQFRSGSLALCTVELLYHRRKTFAQVACQADALSYTFVEGISTMKSAKDMFVEFLEQIKCWNRMFNNHMDHFTDSATINDLVNWGEDAITMSSIVEDARKNDYSLKTFGLPMEFLKSLPLLNALQTCTLFSKTARKFVEQATQTEKLSLAEFVVKVFLPALTKVSDILQEFASGKILLTTIDDILFGNSVDTLKNDLTTFTSAMQQKLPSLDGRFHQVEEYVNLRVRSNTMALLHALRQRLKLTGDFRTLDNLKKPQMLRLEDVDDSVMNASTLMATATDERMAVLEAFTSVSSEKFITWMQGESEGGREKRERELKSFIEIVRSNGDPNEETLVLLTSFNKVLNCYAPLLYRLKQQDGLDAMLHQLQEVWKATDNEKKIPETMRYLNQRGLVKLKQLWDEQGDFEKATRMELDQIMQQGLYIVGCVAGQVNEVRCWQSAVAGLQPPEDIKNLAELKDLLNKLMLISSQQADGKKNLSIEEFSNVHEAASSLGELLIKHEQAGNTFFSDCEFKFRCTSNAAKFKHDGDGEATLMFKSTLQTVHTAKIEDQMSVATQINSLNHLLHECLLEWEKHFLSMRAKYPCLNYFTNRQIVRLQKHLHDVRANKPLDADVAMLLMDVKPSVGYGDLRKALKDTIGVTETDIQEADNVGSLPPTAKQDFAAKMFSSIRNLNLEQNDFTNDFEEEAEDSTEVKLASELQYLDEQSDDDVDIESETMILAERLQRHWYRYLDKHRHSNIKDVLTVDELGLVLAHLEKASFVQDPLIEIKPPEWLTTVKTSFFVVPRDWLLQTVLLMFIQSESRNMCLPRSSEILICQTWTSCEQVQLFLQRMSQCSVQRLFILVGVDSLTADVAQQIVRNMTEHSLQQDRPASLVVLCSSEGTKCMIANYFSRFEVKLPKAGSNWQDTCNFVRRALCVANDVPEIRDVFDVLPNHHVCLITSIGYGQGKTLTIDRIADHMDALYDGKFTYIKIPIHSKQVELPDVLKLLQKHSRGPTQKHRRMIHLDISHHATVGVDTFLFQLLIGCLEDKYGNVWKRIHGDHYAIEISSTSAAAHQALFDQSAKETVKSLRYAFPVIVCHDPYTAMKVLNNERTLPNTCFHRCEDYAIMDTIPIQKCAQFLMHVAHNTLETFIYVPNEISKDYLSLLTVLLKHCGLKHPSWAELRHFCFFLYQQLSSAESSYYCDTEVTQGDLPGFRSFVVKFMIRMSRDFATRSLKISEEVVRLQANDMFETLEDYQLVEKQQWESKPHPYLFFNYDKTTFSFFGCMINDNGDLINPQTNRILESGLISRELLLRLLRQPGLEQVLRGHVDGLNRSELLIMLHRVLGNSHNVEHYDPDPLYELTPDCVLKMLAIEMRFRAGIPVVIMGETGCGKTRLIQFLCSLKLAKLTQNNEMPIGVENMFVMKLHSGVSERQMKNMIDRAIEAAERNNEIVLHNIPVTDPHDDYDVHVDTCLFFDEANTSPLITLIKEIMVDGTFNGTKLDLARHHVKVVAAVNPYRKHNDNVLTKLKSAGLGYLDESNRATEKFGNVPLRHLVYRVHPLPPSLISLVWDFGILNNETEAVYINRMVTSFQKRETTISFNKDTHGIIVAVLSAAQKFMRIQQDECSFVSLRDIERVLKVFKWFYEHRDMLYDEMNEVLEQEQQAHVQAEGCDEFTRSLVLALCVCYRCALQERRDAFDTTIASHFAAPLRLPHGKSSIALEVDACQRVFLQGAQLDANIARNIALKENLFLMIIAVELRIPLFVIGRPGSSKTLAKTVLARSMKGADSETPFYQKLKEAQVMTYQCSPSSTAEGVEDVFRKCAKNQKLWQDSATLANHVAVAVFDEIGLAEESADLPLKALHGYLEDGCQIKEEQLDAYHKVAFIGISNWALDPANMNRGIFITRPLPSKGDLTVTAKAICEQDRVVAQRMDYLIKPLTEAYIEVYKAQHPEPEFFGLRDFYSTIKAVYDLAALELHRNYETILRSVMHNFSGKRVTENSRNPINVFMKHLSKVLPRSSTVPVRVVDLIKENLQTRASSKDHHESRYLLILTENYAALNILRQRDILPNAMVIIGSNFPQDSSYSQLCRNINRIKVCMLNGRPVILLNLEDIYESLYELLNQSLIELGDSRLVDLGLGTHRVKCKVHNDFKLVVIANHDHALKRFPIALMNRLEKHYLTLTTDLTDRQTRIVHDFRFWVESFSVVSATHGATKFSASDCFVGFAEDTCALLVAELEEKYDNFDDLVRALKEQLLWTATPDALLRLMRSSLQKDNREIKFLWETYFVNQAHSNIVDAIAFWEPTAKRLQKMLLVTTHGSLLPADKDTFITKKLGCNTVIKDLQRYSNEQHFINDVRKVLEDGKQSPQLLLMQCYPGDEYKRLVDCARFRLEECYAMPEFHASQTVIALVVSLPRLVGGCFTSFPGQIWQCMHIDNLLGRSFRVEESHDKPLSVLLKSCSMAALNEEPIFDLLQLLQDTCYRAGPLIVDWGDAALERVKLMCQYLKQSESFRKAVLNRLILLQTDREQNSTNSVGWIIDQACNMTAIFETKTFFEALHGQAETAIAPLMAGLLSVLDTGRSLNFLKDSWYSSIFIALLNDLNFLDIKHHPTSQLFFELGTDDIRRPREKFQLHHPSNSYIAGFPFSWVVFKKINEFMALHLESQKQKSDDDNEQMLAAFDSMTWSEPLVGVWNQQKYLVCYVTDFVTLTALFSDNDLHLLCQQWLYNTTNVGKQFGFIGIHLAYHKLGTSIRLFQQFCAAKPNLAKMLIQNKPVLNQYKMQLTWAALNIIIDDVLEAKYTNLDEYQQWLQALESSCPIVSKLFEHRSFEGLPESFINQLHSRWSRIEIALLLIRDQVNGMTTLSIPTRILHWMQNVQSISSGEFLGQLKEFMREIRLQYSAEIFVEVVNKFVLSIEYKLQADVVEKLFQDYVVGEHWSEGILMRSYLLQRLFRVGNATQIQDLINAYMSLAQGRSEADKTSLVRTVMAYWDEYFQRKAVENPVKWFVDRLNLVDHALEHRIHVNMECMEGVGYARIMISTFVADFCATQKTLNEDERFFFLHAVKTFLQEWSQPEASYFFVRHLNDKGGMEVLKRFCEDENLRCLIPENLLIQENQSPDPFLMYGEKYVELKANLLKAIVERKLIELLPTLEASTNWINENGPFLMTLSTYALSIKLNTEKYENSAKDIAPFLGSTQSPELSCLLSMEYMYNVRDRLGDKGQLVQLIWHLSAAAMSFPRSYLLNLFCNLIKDPASLKKCYLPAMPMDAVVEYQARFQTQDGLRTAKIYVCPNGHPYVVDRCGQPMEILACWVCRQPIGGQNHVPVQNNTEFRAANRVPELGYCYYIRSLNSVLPERQLSRLGTVSVRLLLQAALLGASLLGKSIRDVVPVPDIEDHFKFLLDSWSIDLAHLANELDHNVDECIFFLHLLVKCMSGVQQNSEFQPMNTTAIREDWERVFHDKALADARSSLKDAITQLQGATAADHERRLLQDILYRDEASITSTVQGCLWTDYRSTTLDSLLASLRRQLDSHVHTNQFPVLNAFIEQESVLFALYHLTGVWKLLQRLADHYRGMVDVNDAHSVTIESFLKSLNNVDKDEYTKLFENYFTAWRKLKATITKGPFLLLSTDNAVNAPTAPLLPEDCVPILTKNWKANPIAVCMPLPYRLGLAACALISTLITGQNDFTETIWTNIVSPFRRLTLHPNEVTNEQLIHYDREYLRAMLLLSRQNQDSPQEMFDVAQLQNRLLQRVLHGGVRLKLLMPELKPRQQRTAEKLELIKTHIEQNLLPSHVVQELLRMCGQAKRLTDVTSLLSIVEIVIGFAGSLATLANHQQTLHEFVHANLSMTDIADIVDNLLKETTLHQIVHLWQIATFQRRFLLFINQRNKNSNQDVFPELAKEFRLQLQAEQIATIEKELATRNVQKFVVGLTELLLIHVPHNIKDIQLQCAQELKFHLEFKVDPDNEDWEILPEDVLLGHGIALWGLAVRLFMQNYLVQ